MVQVLQNNERPSGSHRFGEALKQSLPDALSEFIQRKRAEGQLSEENRALEENHGLNLSGVQNPKIREKLLGEMQKKKADTGDRQQDDMNYDTIKGMFGDNFANLWKASSTGARTALLKSGLDAIERDKDISEKFDRAGKPKKEPKETFVDELGYSYPEVKGPEDLKTSEMGAWREARRKENVPVMQEAAQKVKAAQNENRSLRVLNKLNDGENLPEGFARLVVNPSTGKPYALAELSGKIHPDVQRWVKTINDFTTKAKDSYGARVTNFDLQQFMARLPGLMNTAEGRRQIIHQMQVINDLDSLHENALDRVFKHYGAGNITLEEAGQIAEENISETKHMLEFELDQIGQEIDQMDLDFGPSAQQEQTFKSLDEVPTQKGTVVEDDSGQQWEYDGKTWVKVK